MKTNFTSVRRFTVLLSVAGILGTAAPAAQGQTLTGQPDLKQSPISLHAYVSPVANSSIVRVRYVNDGYGSVRIKLRDQRGTALYNEQHFKRQYSGQFDLASLPTGVYTLVVQSFSARHTELIHVNTGTATQIALVTPKLVVGEPVAKSAVSNQ